MQLTRARHIEDYLREHHKELMVYLKDLVRCESPSRDPDSQLEVFSILTDSFRSLGYYTSYVPGIKTGGYLYARPVSRSRGQKIQLLIGHCDTVWRKNTITDMPVLEMNGKLSGPGVFDMKAGITQIVFALRAIQELGLECKINPVILINSDEEIGSFESTNAIKRISKIANRAYILEPPLGLEGSLKTARKGIGKFTLSVRGKPAHAGLNPEKGVSAIIELSYHIQHLFGLNDFEKGITVNVGMIEGGSSANVIAEESRAVIDVRVHNQQDADFIQQEIYAIKPKHDGTSVEVSGGFGRPPMERTKRNRKLWIMAKNIGKQMNLELDQAIAGGGSDGNTTSIYTATLDGLGTVGDGAHARHEYIFIEKLIERTTFLAMLILADELEEERND